MAKSTTKKTTPRKKTAQSAAASRKAPAKKTIKDARKVISDRRYEARKLVTRLTFIGFSFDTSFLQLPGSIFVPQLNALLVDQSAGGCSLVFMRANPLTSNLVVGNTCIVQIEPERVIQASIRWVKELDGKLVNAGFEFAAG
jgi:hypothetical protein